MYNNFPFPQPYSSPNFNSPAFSGQRQGVIKVHGRNGAEAFYMGANDEALLLDDTQPVVWHKKTDGAGYPTINGYSISPLKVESGETKYEEFDKRISILEEKINGLQSNTSELPTVANKELD